MAGTRKPTSIDNLTAAFDAAVEQHRGQATRVAIAYSGGLDSSVLLHLAATRPACHGLTLEAVHCHHALSPNADKWASHCRDTALGYDVPFRLVTLAIRATEGEGVEAAARRERYQAFEVLAADLVLLGHHADDVAETVLLNLFRGSGILGMAAIPERRDRYLRPLLRSRRGDIEAYARHWGLQWCEDESNRNPDYRRNYLRHALIPELARRYPAIAETLADNAERFAEAQSLLDALAALDSGETPMRFPYPISRIRALEPRRAANLLRFILRQAGLQAPPAARMEEFLRQVREARPDRHPKLTLGDHSLEVRQRQLRAIPSS